MDKITCPHCQVVVRPTEDGTCPRCDRLVVETAEVVEPENPFRAPLGRLQDPPWRRERGNGPFILHQAAWFAVGTPFLVLAAGGWMSLVQAGSWTPSILAWLLMGITLGMLILAAVALVAGIRRRAISTIVLGLLGIVLNGALWTVWIVAAITKAQP